METAAKVLQCDFYWPTLFGDAFEYCKSCPRCRQLDRIRRRGTMALNLVIVGEIFDV